MSRTQRFLGGVSVGYISMVLTMVVGLWLTPFLLGQIGTRDYGLWLITTQILGYLMLLDLGVVALAPRETAYATGRAISGAADDVPVTFARFRAIVRWQMIPAAIAAALAWWIVASRWPELNWPIAIILVAFLASFPLRLYHAMLQGLQDLSYLGKVQLASWAAGTLVTIGLVLAGIRLEALAAGWVTTQAISATLCAMRLRSHYTSVWNAPASTPSLNEARELFGRSGWVSLTQIGHVFLSGSDVLVLGAILGPAATVPYACTGKIITVLSNHPQLLMQAAAPAIAEMRTSANRSDVARVAIALMRAMLILSGGVGCFVLVANEAFVRWWVGGQQFAGMTLTLLLLAVMLVRHFATTLIYALFSFGHERRLSLAGISDGVITLVVTFALVRFTSLGILAAAIGSLAGVLLVTIPVCAVALARELQVSVLALLASLRSWAIRFALVAALSLFLSRFVAPHGLTGVVASGAVIGLIYLAAMWTLLIEPPLGTYVPAAMAAISRLLPSFAAHRAPSMGLRVTEVKTAAREATPRPVEPV
jgi:O-antigen/teichoic acid export membrane protein